MNEGRKDSLRTGAVVIVNSETGGIVVVGDGLSLLNPKASIIMRLDVPVREVERLQSVVVGVERVRVQDEGRLEFEERQIVRVVFWINAEVEAVMADVPVGTVGVHQ